MGNRVIMHVDMNSYFASVEQQDNPLWRGKPVGVCEHLGGIIIAASVEAKQLGIKTGTPVWEAQSIYPDIYLTKTHPHRYRYYTKKFLKVVEDYSNHVELYSIDEVFLDVTRAVTVRTKSNGRWIKVDPYAEAARLGEEIRQRIFAEVGDTLRCSIGVGWNKLVAKIGSDYQKPNGLTVFRPEAKLDLVQKIDLEAIPGIGPRQKRNLAMLGILTLKQLNAYPKMNLITRFGKLGLHLWNMGQLEGSWKEGFGDDAVKSMGHMYTMPKEVRKPEVLWPVLSKLSEMVGVRMRTAGLVGSSISAYIRPQFGGGVGGSKRLGYLTSDSTEIFLAARRLLLKQGLSERCTPRLIAVTMHGLTPVSGQQTLFKKADRRDKLGKKIDVVNDKYGEGTIMSMRSFLAKHAIRDSVGFGRVKELDGRAFKSLGRFK